ncbi:diaminobutyrate acetyltransferase [uncultured Roseovarius sp.]|uniref:diaminobutyrate acetyltransferase n=2 Tax=Roseovarius TaxID=74030 RepID=UPI0025E6A85C|nr:diaminobutyrate acetyltransferase [uncultured Roseovarius sp.]
MRHAMEMFRKALPTLRKPTAADGAEIWELIQKCKPLDENSMYCNLVQCDHFRDTCVVAEMDGEIVGWVSGYTLPDDPETLFVWQVAVSEKARGTGLGTLMLRGLLSREECKDVTRLQTTITRDNAASWALFRKFANLQNGELSSAPYFTQSLHFKGLHDSEYMVTVALQERMKKAA